MTNGSEPARLGHRPPLDGLRAVAVAAVVGFHGGFPGLSGGAVGVTWFFVLSGFLITTLLLEEADRGPIRLRRFYVRRAVRLLPSLYLVLGVFLVLSTFALSIDGRQFVAAGFYFMNVFPLVYPSAGKPAYFIHVWTLSLEEQFYLVWPVALLVLRSRRSLAVLAGAAIGLAFVQRTLLAYDVTQSAWLTLPIFTLDTFAVGAVMAFARRRGVLDRILRIPAIVPVALAVGLVDVVVREEQRSFVRMVRPTISELAAAVVIAHLVCRPHERLARFLGLRPLVYIGGLSYAIYLWHLPIFEAFKPRTAPDLSPIARHGAKYGLTLLAAVVTFHLLERPLQTLRQRLRTA